MLELLGQLHKVSNSFSIRHTGCSITVSVSITVAPREGITHDGNESKSFNGSARGQADPYSPVLRRAVKWATANRRRPI